MLVPCHRAGKVPWPHAMSLGAVIPIKCGTGYSRRSEIDGQTEMPHDTGDQDALRRAITERAREFAADNRDTRPHRYWQHAIALVLALLVVALVFLGFDTFLTSMQKLIAIMGADPTPTAPMPVFMVPESPGEP